MILAAGLTPAWQQILVFDALAIGEVNRARDARWCASGKVLNVAVALHHLGSEVRTLSVVGGQAGEAIRREFRELGVPARWIESATPTRICTTLLDAKTHRTTELVENSRPLPAAELDAFRGAFAEEAARAGIVVLSGSLPAGTPATFYRDLLSEIRGPVILDVRGPELLAALDRRPFLVKPNREELARTLGGDLRDDAALVAAMREINRRGAEWVVVTQGSSPVWATQLRAQYCLQPPVAAVVNPIGCGDCFAAGIAWALGAGREPIEAITLGMAAAVDNLGQLLPARLDRDRVHDIAGRIRVETC